MSKKFAEYSSFNLSDINKEVLKKWDVQDIFHKSLETRKGHPSFIFYEGPPSANGMPGIHHVMARTIKDIFCRYKTMKGFLVNRKAGWDTHGLPVELGVEKRLGITKEDIGKKIETLDNRRQKSNVAASTAILAGLLLEEQVINQRVGRPDPQDGLLGGHEQPLHHLRQPLHRNTLVVT